jgi:ABC-type histidine transport system ATPase subunit
MRPKALLFDEITSALDPELVGEVLGIVNARKAEPSCPDHRQGIVAARPMAASV